MEPSRYSGDDPSSLLGHVDISILENMKALKAFASRLNKLSLNTKTREIIARILYDRPDVTSCSAELGKALDSGEMLVRCYALMALGSSTDKMTRELVKKSLDSADLATRRAAFLAAERSTDTSLIPRMLEIIQNEDKDVETRINAAYTGERLSRGAFRINIFLPEKERDAQIESAKKWWEANKEKYKIGK